MAIVKAFDSVECTCCGDVLKTLECKRGLGYGSYSIYKICNNRNFNGWFYIMFVEDDKFPIPLTEEEAEDFLEDPSKGATFAHNIFFDRYR